ncbi:MAG: RrF2 family transcriptional regulator [Phycisphaerales bacterium]|nr:MAG: RrF2 family transcriptional regulator [Phycisphaerales bacterium]
MRISTKGRYGLRAMFELARGYGKGPLLMSAIAERQGLSRKHLHALLTSLKSAGLVRSIRGPGGGFVLAKTPKEIKLSEVLSVLEGSLVLVDCVASRQACDRVSGCATHKVWRKLSETIEGVLDSVTLEDLAGQGVNGHSQLKSKKKTRKVSRCGKPAIRRQDGASRGQAKKGR